MNVSNTSRCIRECPSGVWPEGRLFQQLNQRLTHISGKSQIIILILQRHKWNSSVSVTQETGLHPPGLSVQQQSRYYCQFLLWYFNLLWCFFNVLKFSFFKAVAVSTIVREESVKCWLNLWDCGGWRVMRWKGGTRFVKLPITTRNRPEVEPMGF